MLNEEVRYPLSPMHDNILAGACEPPPPALELPAAIKGENLEVDLPVGEPRSGLQAPVAPEDARSPLTRLSEGAAVSGVRPPSAELFYGEGGQCGGCDESAEGSDEGDFAPPPQQHGADGGPGGDGAPVEPLQLLVKLEEDKSEESAIQALLALQREPSPTTPTSSRDASPERRDRPRSPNMMVRHSGIQKGFPAGGDAATRFFCKFPRCGKAYASTDAVRKHCRQRHLDWLRRLGHGCPALYCRWEE